MKNLHRVRFTEALECRLVQETVKRGLSSVEELIPVLVEEYFRMWDDMEGGVALLQMDDAGDG